MTKKKNDGNRMDKRFRWVLALLAVAFIAVVVRLLIICVFNGNRYSQTALSQSEQSVTTISAKRGDITDRNGVQLATSNVTYNLILDPKVILSNADKYLEPTVSLIEECFGLSASDLTATINEQSERSYVVLTKNLSYNEVEDFIEKKSEDSSVAGVWLEETYQRNYNFSTLACSVLGFMGEGKGIYGLEYEYDEELTGTDGREYTYVNSDNVLETERIDAVNGYKIQTTIDYNIQSIVENKIKEFMETTESKTVACIIQNPNTGEIYAMADSDDFDCNKPWDLSLHYTAEESAAMTAEEKTDALSEVWKNFCITESYEPGSTYKPFTMAAGFEENAISLSDTYYCSGSKEFQDDTVKCHNTSGHGTLTTKQALAESCNVALMDMAEKIGAANFCKYQSKFGFGQYTGIDLPNEMNCKYLLYNEDNMTEIDLATNSFGQNFNLTMIQLSTAFCSLINGGYYYKPYIVNAIYNDDGELVQSVDKTLVSRTISEDTSDTLKEALRLVVTEGTGDYAAIDGYVIAGKTGTGEKAGREDGKYLVSFIGFAPYDSPEVVCYVVIDEPESGDEHGVSSTLFNMIMSEVLPYMNIKTADQDYDPEAQENITTEETQEAEEAADTDEDGSGDDGAQEEEAGGDEEENDGEEGED